MNNSSLIFQNINDLSRLPYFALDKGRLILQDKKDIGPIIDAHTHFAFGFVLPYQVQLFKLQPYTYHMCPASSPINLDVYANLNFTPATVKKMRNTAVKQCISKKGDHQTQTAANLLQEMNDLGIERSVILPIDLPLISNNTKVFLQAAIREKRFIPFGSLHPFSIFLKSKLDKLIQAGIYGLKIHPTIQLIRPNHPRAMKLYQLCNQAGVKVLWHGGPVGGIPGIESKGAWKRCQVRNFLPAIVSNPRVTFILGHAGALQMDIALKIARKYPNVYLEISGQSISNLRRLFHEADPNRILFGTDWPYYHEALTLAKVLLATEDNTELRRKVLYENAFHLFELK